MRKTTLFVLPILFVAGVIFLTPLTHAADSSAPEIPQTDAVVLKQTLDTLKSFLDMLSAQVNANDEAVVENATLISASLDGIKGELKFLDGTLAAIGHAP